ncbi:MAG: CrcB family protein [Wenzhouxiangella sp.]|nr:CrcB family protein [Wenzhouxiangella sp.]MCH8476449.1 CrcB family protein [Wenzhouxiangella sp.]TVR95152.1 MAG: camphor resistance protein CrcB [Wenzhouxiangellaceae bacterium]
MPAFTTLLLVMLAGSAGAVARLSVTRLGVALLGQGFPWGTLAVNFSGALLAGLLAGGLSAWLGLEPGSGGWNILVYGFLGSYTTVSSLSLEWLLLLRDGRGRAAWAYLALSLCGGVMLALSGLLVAAQLS